jgi:hypothetical protein
MRPCLIETAAIPTFASPFRWRVIARLSDAYELYDIDIADARIRSRTPPLELLTAISRRIPDQRNASTNEAASEHPARALLDFARFPQAQVVGDSTDEATVRFRDMRFVGLDEDSPLQARRASLFTAVVKVGGP